MSVVEQPEVFRELVRNALAQWASQVVERMSTDKAFAARLQSAWVELIDSAKDDEALPAESPLDEDELKRLLVSAVHETMTGGQEA